VLFNSSEFLLFFPIVTLLYFILPHKLRWLHLLVSSCVFYCAFIPVYISILFLTIVIDYLAGIYIDKNQGRTRKVFLIVSLITNIGILCVFKYNNFFIDNVTAILQALSINRTPISHWNILLPLGLSFHTFQAMSYTIEVYKGKQKPQRHFGIYALYVMFYPQLVAGPIERPQNVMHQYLERHRFNPEMFLDGLRLMLWGFFKKLVIADRISVYVNVIYDNPSQYHSLNVAIAMVFFAIQIYCDFSGYTDIARGAARTMGFNLMQNFNRPYQSVSVTEFWSRWHISLSTWFRDYLYIPLGGNRGSRFRNYINLAIVFMVSGLWHGASWTFVVWGALHGLYVITERVGSKFFEKIPSLIRYVVTFILVCLAWVFFRAADFHQATAIFHSLITNFHNVPFAWFVGTHFGKHSMMLSVLFIGFMLMLEKFTKPELLEFNNKKFVDIIFCSLVLTLIICFGIFTNSSFIYFQF